jgi:type II secretion system protein J
MMNDEFQMTKDEGNPNVECRTGSRPALPAGFGLRNSLVIRHSSFVIRQRAFTLLELLLAVAVFAIVLAAVHTVFFSAFKLRKRTTDAIERSLPLQQTLAIIKRDLANLVPPGGALSGSLQSTPTITTNASGVSISGLLGRQNGPLFFTAAGIVDDYAPWGEIERVSYYLATPTNDTPGMDLFRSVARNLLPVSQDETDDQFLMSGVDAIYFQFHNGTAWEDNWDSTEMDSATGLTNNLPKAIKVELHLHNETRSAGTPAPVELIVALPVLARTNAWAEIATTTTTGGEE